MDLLTESMTEGVFPQHAKSLMDPQHKIEKFFRNNNCNGPPTQINRVVAAIFMLSAGFDLLKKLLLVVTVMNHPCTIKK